MSKFLYSRNKSNISTSPLISFTYFFKEHTLDNFFHIFLHGTHITVCFFKERALGCLSSRFLYLNFKEHALGCGFSRFSCALSSNSNVLCGLWTWSVVNGTNVSIFDDLYLDASCVLSSLYYSKLRLLLWVSI